MKDHYWFGLHLLFDSVGYVCGALDSILGLKIIWRGFSQDLLVCLLRLIIRSRISIHGLIGGERIIHERAVNGFDFHARGLMYKASKGVVIVDRLSH